MFHDSFPKNRPDYQTMWNDTAEPDGPQMTIWCNRIACWITKATNTLNIHLLLFHYNNGCINAPQCYVIRTLPVMLRSEDVSITLSPQPGGQEYLPLFDTVGPSSN